MDCVFISYSIVALKIFFIFITVTSASSEKESQELHHGSNDKHSAGLLSGPGDSHSKESLNGPSDSRSKESLNGPGDSHSKESLKGPGDNNSGEVQNGPGDNNSGEVQNGPGDNNSGEVQNGPGDNNSGEVQNGPGDNNSGEVQNRAHDGPSKETLREPDDSDSKESVNGTGDSPSKGSINGKGDNNSGEVQNGPGDNSSGEVQNRAHDGPSKETLKEPGDSDSKESVNGTGDSPSKGSVNGTGDSHSGEVQNGPGDNNSEEVKNGPGDSQSKESANGPVGDAIPHKKLHYLQMDEKDNDTVIAKLIDDSNQEDEEQAESATPNPLSSSQELISNAQMIDSSYIFGDSAEGNETYNQEEKRYKEELKRGNKAESYGTNPDFYQPDKYIDLNRRFVPHYRYNEDENINLAKERVKQNLEPQLASSDLVLAVAKESAILEASRPRNPSEYAIEKKSLRNGNYWNALWKEEMNPTVLRSNRKKPLGVVAAKINPGSNLYDLVTKLKQISPRLLYVINKKTEY